MLLRFFQGSSSKCGTSWRGGGGVRVVGEVLTVVDDRSGVGDNKKNNAAVE